MIYFISDAHLGSLATEHRRTQERRLVRFLDDIKKDAEAVFMLGDMFDFWYEYKRVVPKGFTRFLGKISELTDMGIEVHYFTGNHDIWAYSYLEEECGVILHRKPTALELHGKTFYLIREVSYFQGKFTAYGTNFVNTAHYLLQGIHVLQFLFNSILCRRTGVGHCHNCFGIIILLMIIWFFSSLTPN